MLKFLEQELATLKAEQARNGRNGKLALEIQHVLMQIKSWKEEA